MILADQFPFLLHNASFSTSAVFLRSLPLWCRGAVAKRGGPSVSREVGKNPCKAQAWLLLNLPNPLHTKWERCPPRGMLAGRATKALACSERPARSHPAPLDVEPQRGQRGRARSRGKGERVRATESEVSREGEGAGWVPREGEKRLDRQGPPTNSPEAHGESGLGAHPHRTLQSLCSGGSSTQDRTGHTESASASSEGGVGLIPDKGTEIPLAVWCDQKKVKFRTMPDPGTHSIIMLALGVSLVLVLTGFEEGNGSIQPG